MRRLRRSLRPVRSSARRARARLGDLGALLHTRGISAEDVRWVAKTALARGERALAEEAFLELVRLGKASAEEQRRVRRLADSAGPPAGPGPDEPAPPAGGAQLVIWRDRADGPLHATLADRPDQPLARTGTLPAWRSGWSELPRSLADQLAAGALTRIAHVNHVTSVRADDAWSGSLAAEVSRAVTNAGRPSAPAQEKIL